MRKGNINCCSKTGYRATDRYNKITYSDYDSAPVRSKDLHLITPMNFIVYG